MWGILSSAALCSDAEYQEGTVLRMSSQHLLYHDECSLIERKFHILTYEEERGREHLDPHSFLSFWQALFPSFLSIMSAIKQDILTDIQSVFLPESGQTELKNQGTFTISWHLVKNVVNCIQCILFYCRVSGETGLLSFFRAFTLNTQDATECQHP